jgi:hypothetical protein
MVLTLRSGAYAARVSGADEGEGVVLIESYQIEP